MSVVKYDIFPEMIDTVFFESRIIKTDNCWEWVGSIGTHGYGIYCFKGTRLLAHRVSFCLKKGSISKDKVIDHICRNKICVRPDHLRNVSQFMNTTENNSSIISDNYNKTKCKNGHALSGYNLKMVLRKKEGKRYRVCRICYNRLILSAYHKRVNRSKECWDETL